MLTSTVVLAVGMALAQTPDLAIEADGGTPAAEPAATPAAATPEPEQPRPTPIAGMVAVGLGALSASYAFEGGRWGDLMLLRLLEARLDIGRLALDGSALFSVPSAANGTAANVTFTVRAGYNGERWSALIGPSLQHARGVRPAWQLLPSATGHYSLERFDVVAGIFDHHGIALARAGIRAGWFTVAYLAPLGLELGAHVPLGRIAGVKAKILGFRVANSDFVMAMLELTGRVGTEVTR